MSLATTRAQEISNLHHYLQEFDRTVILRRYVIPLLVETAKARDDNEGSWHLVLLAISPVTMGGGGGPTHDLRCYSPLLSTRANTLGSITRLSVGQRINTLSRVSAPSSH